MADVRIALVVFISVFIENRLAFGIFDNCSEKLVFDGKRNNGKRTVSAAFYQFVTLSEKSIERIGGHNLRDAFEAFCRQRVFCDDNGIIHRIVVADGVGI